MKNIILYTTKYGSVREAAELLTEGLAGETTLVNIAREPAPPLDSYDAVILGGSVYVGRVQKKLTAFIASNLELLLKNGLGFTYVQGQRRAASRKKRCVTISRLRFTAMRLRKMSSVTRTILKRWAFGIGLSSVK